MSSFIPAATTTPMARTSASPPMKAGKFPQKCCGVGPGDRVSVIFSLAKGIKKYHVYFGNPTPPPNKPGMDDVKIEGGLLLDMHEFATAPRSITPPRSRPPGKRPGRSSAGQ